MQLFSRDRSLVQAAHTDLREWETHFFEHVVNDEGETFVFEDGEYFEDWTEFVFFPLFMLAPAKGGTQAIVAELHLFSEEPDIPRFNNGKLVQGGTKQRTLTASNVVQFSRGAGYLGEEKNRRAAAEATIRLGMAIAISDGSMDASAKVALKRWAKKYVASTMDHVSEKNLVNKYLAYAVKDAAAGILLIDNCLTQLNNVGSENALLSAVELCSEIVVANGDVDKHAMQLFYKIVSGLNISEEQGKLFLDKKNSTGATKIESRRNPAYEKLLGLTKDMPLAEIKKKLTDEFRKWNSRAAHSDAGLRARAEEMLLLIGEARAELLG